MIKKTLTILTKPEDKTNKIGLFRIITAIFGGLITAYLGMVSLALILPFAMADLSVISLLFNTLAWAMMMLWIMVSPTKLSALLRFLVPCLVFCLSIYFLY